MMNAWARSSRAGLLLASTAPGIAIRRQRYRVIFIPFKDGVPDGMPKEILTGFLDREKGETRGRPVGVVVDKKGGLLVADDVGNIIWRVTKTPPLGAGRQ